MALIRVSEALANGSVTGPEAESHSEGIVAKTIEEQTAKLPSDAFLWAAIAAIGLALAMQASGKKHGSLFVGQWCRRRPRGR